MVTWRAPKFPANPFKKATSSPPPPEGSGTIRGAWSSASAPKNIWPNGGPSGRPQASAGRIRARAARLTTVKSAPAPSAQRGGTSHVRPRHPPLAAHAVADEAGAGQALQQVHRHQDEQHGDLERHELAG